MVLIVLGLLSVVVPRPTRETERIDGPVRARNSTRRLGMLAVAGGVALLLREPGML